MTATMTAGGIGLFLLLWGLLRSSIFTVVLVAFGVTLLGAGILDRIARTVVSVIATVLNGVGGAL